MDLTTSLHGREDALGVGVGLGRDTPLAESKGRMTKTLGEAARSVGWVGGASNNKRTKPRGASKKV